MHRIDIPQRLAWGKVSIAPAPGGWRVGTADGPPANAVQLRLVLADLGSVEIGGRCTGWVEGPSAYPCGFAVRGLSLAGSAADEFTTTALDWTPDPQRAQAAIDARPQADMKGLISPLPDAPRFVGVRVPPGHLSVRGAAYGGELKFEFRALSNPLVPSLFDYASGRVALCGGMQGLPS